MIIHAWGFPAGDSFVLDMQHAFVGYRMEIRVQSPRISLNGTQCVPSNLCSCICWMGK